ncbi:hypothetical protein OIU74_026970 [Salix koriyanagi]|uniref:Uncharacterized protein n=1 Tax=Salix koriyanagi TaxID=2511006 RepID=A0A9Q0VZQ5_9ROSI|nr:hypothetical protein OIU74_026970 [Salix koriyanagi]
MRKGSGLLSIFERFWCAIRVSRNPAIARFWVRIQDLAKRCFLGALSPQVFQHPMFTIIKNIKIEKGRKKRKKKASSCWRVGQLGWWFNVAHLGWLDLWAGMAWPVCRWAGVAFPGADVGNDVSLPLQTVLAFLVGSGRQHRGDLDILVGVTFSLS